MTLRFLAVVVTMLLSVGPAHSAKPAAKAASVRTWKTLIDHMLANGSVDYIKAPTSRTLGFDSDKVEVKGLYLKSGDSSDGREHSFEVVYDMTDKKVVLPREIVIARIRITEKNPIKDIDANRLRLSLDGNPIKGMHASGIVGKVKQVALNGDSLEAKEFLAAERKFWLKEVDLAKLVQ